MHLAPTPLISCPATVARAAEQPRGDATRRPIESITNHRIAGDELFDAVVFLGHALALPDLLPAAPLRRAA